MLRVFLLQDNAFFFCFFCFCFKSLKNNLLFMIYGLKHMKNIFFSFLGCRTLTATATAQKIKLFIKDFFSKSDPICSFLWIWSHLVEKSLTENFILCAVCYISFFLFSFLMIFFWSKIYFFSVIFVYKSVIILCGLFFTYFS